MNTKPSSRLTMALYLFAKKGCSARQAAIRADIAVSTIYRSRQYREMNGLPERKAVKPQQELPERKAVKPQQELPELKASTWRAEPEI
jgi:transposase